jgi:putative flippase GtrA
MAQMRLRIYEMGVSYAGRTYEEGKKIGVRDGFRALYCILRYNAFKAPTPLQFLIYLGIGGISAGANILLFLFLRWLGSGDTLSIPAAFFLAAIANYFLCISLLFRHRARWSSPIEIGFYVCVVLIAATVDFFTTRALLEGGLAPWAAKSIACGVGLIFNFLGRKYIVFPEPAAGPWTSRKKP